MAARPVAAGHRVPHPPDIDLADPGFWDSGLALVEEQLGAAEGAAREAGRLTD